MDELLAIDFFENPHLTEEEFVGLPLFTEGDPESEYPRAERFKRWMFKMVKEFSCENPIESTPDDAISTRQLLGVLSLGDTPEEGVERSIRVLNRSTAITAADLCSILSHVGVRDDAPA